MPEIHATLDTEETEQVYMAKKKKGKKFKKRPRDF